MKKYALTSLFFLTYIGFTTAQLTIQKLESNRKKSFPLGALIEIKLPTKTSRPDCNCFQSYKGYLKKVEKDGISLVITEATRETVDENKAAFQEIKTFKHPEEPVTTRIPLTKMQSITRYRSNENAPLAMGVTFVSVAVLSNLFLAPQLDKPFDKKFRNGGYALMGLGLLVALIPTRKTFYFEQPKKGKKKKTLWKLGN